MARTIIVNPQPTKSEDDDSTGLWVVMLVAFAVVLLAIIGFNKTGHAPAKANVVKTETTTTTVR